MSVRWITWAWDQACPNPTEKFTLLALADHAGEDGRCWPSSGRIAEKTGQGQSTVRRHIEAMEKRGLLHRIRRFREDGSETSSFIQLGEPLPDPSGGVLNMSGGVLVDEQGGCSPVSTLEPSLEPSVNQETPCSPPAHINELGDDFGSFWTRYPRKVGKTAALTAFRRARRKASFSEIIGGLEGWMRYWHAKNEPEFVPHPTTWLNQERWNDEPPPAPARKLSSVDKVEAEMRARGML